MPKQTFLNLKEGKRTRIRDAALKEFAVHDYKHVNIQNIIKDAHISRGSFYQYFEDLNDLFSYLINYIIQEKKAYLTKHAVLHSEAPFFDRLNELYRLGYQFALDNPLIYEAGKHMVKPVSKNQNETMLIRKHELREYYINEIKKDIQNGSLRPDIDIDMLIDLLTSFLDELTQSHFIEQRLTQQEVDQRFKRFIKLLKEGIE